MARSRRIAPSNEQEQSPNKTRKTRSDKDSKKLPLRAVKGVQFAAEQTYVTLEQLAQWLAPEHTPAIDIPAEDLPNFDHGGARNIGWPLDRQRRLHATAQLVDRWEKDHGLVETWNEIAEWPVWVRATPLALRRFGYDWADAPFPEEWDRLAPDCHYERVTAIRLLLARKELQTPEHRWIPERQLLAEQGEAKAGERRPHRPDGYLYLQKDGAYDLTRGKNQVVVATIPMKEGQRVAIELEKSRKEDAKLEYILPDLLRHYDFAWYFCESEKVYNALVAARRDFLASDEERKRIRIVFREKEEEKKGESQ